MDWQWTPPAIILLTTCGLSLGLAILLFRRREIRGVSTLAVLMVAIAYYTLVTAFEAAAVPLARKILFSKLEYVATGTVPVLFLLFALRFTGRTAWMTRWRAAALWILPPVSISLAATNELHRWVWTDFTPGPAGLNAVVYGHGPAFYVLIIAIYVYMLAGSVLLIGSAIRSPVVQRRQSIMVLLAATVPLVCAVLYAIGITPIPGLNLPPLSFAAAGAVLAVGVVPLRLFKLIPVAREQLIEGMSDGILVLDADRRIVDVNPAARKLLDLGRRIIGVDAADALPQWSRIEGSFDPQREVHLELTLSDDPLVHVDLRVAPLRRPSRALVGFLIAVRDISKRYLAETSLQNANERLQSHVREIERLQEELRDQAIRDALTGLFNRRYLDEVMPRILERAGSGDTPVSIVLFDIDHFKQVNDRRGHLAGDALLEKLGSLLARRTRPGDVACRYGGEEFLLVLPDAPLDTAMERAEALRRDVQAVAIAELAPDGPPTLSAGVAVFPRHGASQDQLVHAADGALYRAKAAGRDCVRSADNED